MYCKRNIVLILGLLVSLIGYSQKKTTKKDYQRATSFLWENLNNNKVFNTYIRPYWAEDNSGIAFITRDEKGKYFKKITFKNKKKTSLFDHQKVATLINKKLNKEYSEFTLPFNRINYKNKKEILFTVDRKEYILDLKSYSLSENKKEEKNNEFETISPDGKWIAFTRDYNLFIRSTEDGTEHQLSTAGKKNYEYASYYGWYDLMEGENGERPSHFYVNWSPDSKWIQTNICDLRQADKMYLLDWSIDSLYRPKLLSYYRGSPGDTTMVHMKPVVFDITSKKEIHPELPTNTHINAVSLRWSDTNKNVLYADYQNRGYQDVHLLKVDVDTGKKQVLYKETSTTNIDRFEYWLIEKRNTAIVASEKSGWQQLYTINLTTGEEKPLTQGTYYIDDILSIDEERGIIYFVANGKEDINPYYSHVYKVDLDQRKTVLLTPEKAHHQALFSPDNNYFIDNYSTAQQPTVTVLREAKTGKIITTMSKADIEKIKATGWQSAQTFTALARDNKTTIYGAYWVPSNFDPNKKYPVIDHTYTGPHTQMFPRSFGRAISLENQAIAELGFIVVMIDGLGSSSRSKAFHNYSYKNLGGNLEDHKRAIEQLAKKHSFIDQERIGIFGHSAGGYDAAHALLQFPEFYKVAVSSSADHDHRMEKAWWPEMYMGWPVDSVYHNQSNVTMAKNLKGKLLLVHGGIDENVNPSATFKLAEALIKANKDFDLLIMPSQHHGYRGKHRAYFRKKRWNYFVEHLLEQQPIWDFEDK
ncbi:S9 family peptidase [Aquimarina rhabdastrellae]